MSDAADFATVRRDDPGGSKKIVTAPMTTNSAAPTPETDPLRSESCDTIAVWVNEGGAGGEVLR